MKVYMNGQGHMTKKSAMAINNKKPLKNFSRSRRPMILKLCMKYQGAELYKVNINHDPGMTLAYSKARQGQPKSPMHLNGENCQLPLEGKNLKEMGKWIKGLIF